MDLNTERLVWVDTKTTGLDYQNDILLEIAVVVTDREFNEVGSYQSVIKNNMAEVSEQINPFCMNMHTTNGLIKDLTDPRLTKDRGIINKEIRELITSCNAMGAAWAGSTVDFDQNMIKKELLLTFDKLLHYRKLDVTSIRIFSNLTRPEVPSYPTTASDSVHRAMSDIRASISQLRHYIDHRVVIPYWSTPGGGMR